mmetsp:Transcript_27757/g.54496  ORF Transcript_27757/g.54496 Transcript_27757/m.54496 type:complete len:146 (+) Transcript_27757:191-628(+)
MQASPLLPGYICTRACASLLSNLFDFCLAPDLAGVARRANTDGTATCSHSALFEACFFSHLRYIIRHDARRAWTKEAANEELTTHTLMDVSKQRAGTKGTSHTKPTSTRFSTTGTQTSGPRCCHAQIDTGGLVAAPNNLETEPKE